MSRASQPYRWRNGPDGNACTIDVLDVLVSRRGRRWRAQVGFMTPATYHQRRVDARRWVECTLSGGAQPPRVLLTSAERATRREVARLLGMRADALPDAEWREYMRQGDGEVETEDAVADEDPW